MVSIRIVASIMLFQMAVSSRSVLNVTDTGDADTLGEDDFCGCQFNILMDYSVAVEHYPQRFGAPENARKMTGLTPTSTQTVLD